MSGVFIMGKKEPLTLTRSFLNDGFPLMNLIAKKCIYFLPSKLIWCWSQILVTDVTKPTEANGGDFECWHYVNFKMNLQDFTCLLLKLFKSNTCTTNGISTWLGKKVLVKLYLLLILMSPTLTWYLFCQYWL